jgi:hypothetical protein
MPPARPVQGKPQAKPWFINRKSARQEQRGCLHDDPFEAVLIEALPTGQIAELWFWKVSALKFREPVTKYRIQNTVFETGSSIKKNLKIATIVLPGTKQHCSA